MSSRVRAGQEPERLHLYVLNGRNITSHLHAYQVTHTHTHSWLRMLHCFNVLWLHVVDPAVTCNHGNGGCQHTCEDTESGPICRCHARYTLQPDKRSCVGKHTVDMFNTGNVKSRQTQGCSQRTNTRL